MKRFLSTITISVAAAMSVYGQSGAEALHAYMSKVREGSYKPIPNEILNTKNQTALFESVRPYLSDSLSTVRSKAYYIVKRIGQNSTNQGARTRAIDILITGIKDQDTGISGNASESLTGFKKENFTAAHKEAIADFIKPGTPHLDEVLKLAGYIEVQGGSFDLIINSSLPVKYKWAARLALARMGDQKAIDYLLSKLQAAPINDNFVYDFVPDLVYTRQVEIFKFLEGIIQSEEKNCLSADPDASGKILCGYRVMEELAPAIENYPLPVDEFGELEVDDYEQALREVRRWFAQNKTYVIKKEAY